MLFYGAVDDGSFSTRNIRVRHGRVSKTLKQCLRKSARGADEYVMELKSGTDNGELSERTLSGVKVR